jgi:DNA-binding NarL/FixJ family response regulator
LNSLPADHAAGLATPVAVVSPTAERVERLARGLAARGDAAIVLRSTSLVEARAAAWGGARVVVLDLDVVDAGDGASADEPDAAAAGSPSFVLVTDRPDDRLGGWLIDGCSVVPRRASLDALAAAVRAAANGLVTTSGPFAAEALRYERTGVARPAQAAPLGGPLTPRERQVLAEMSHGRSNREIGGALGISAHTAKFHVAQIIAKLDAQSRGHAIAKAMRAGIVDTSELER